MNKKKKSQELLSQTLQNLRRRNPSSHKKVAMREIALADTKMSNGRIEKNASNRLRYFGPFTDPNIEIDIRKGLPRIREQWILDRNDVEELTEISSEYGKSV
jgi:phosphomethylpyrimidine synthase